jgi:5'-3' exonuclease
LALLLGSDYTDGIRGIGIVNATEIVNAFPGRDGLKEFKEWVHSFNLSTADEILGGSKRKERLAQIPLQDKKARFKVTHSNARRKWELGEAFPNNQVIKAYEAPQVDRSSAKFSWALPDLQALRNFCSNMFGWEKQKTDGTLLPLMEKLNSRTIQTRIDSFFTSYQDNIKYAKVSNFLRQNLYHPERLTRYIFFTVRFKVNVCVLLFKR